MLYRLLVLCLVFSLVAATSNAQPIRLTTTNIDTEAVATHAQLTKSSADKIAADAVAAMQGVATTNVLPYLVQFNGPIQKGWQEAVKAEGGKIKGYIPDHAFIVELTAPQANAVAALPMVRWIGFYRPNYKISPSLSAAMGTNSAAIVVTVQTMSASYIETVVQKIISLGGVVISTSSGMNSGSIRSELTSAMIKALATMPEVNYIERYVAPVLHNNVATDSDHMNLRSVWTQTPSPLTGTNQIVAVADTGLDTGNMANMHPDFSNRILAAYALARDNDWSDCAPKGGHGTHVAGSVLGNGAAYSNGLFRGSAYRSTLVFQSIMDADGLLSGLPDNLTNLFNQVYTNGARIHSDSWGSNARGQYTDYAQQLDEFVWYHPDMLIFFSAGNDGVDSQRRGVINYGSMGSPATAKNAITVGAAQSTRPAGSGGYSASPWGVGTWNPKYPVNPIHDALVSTYYDGVHQGMAAFSSRGPCLDGRTKPDIVAPGTDIVSCRPRVPGTSTGWGTGDGVLADILASTNYVFNGGTSMATPLSAGAAALVRQYFADYRSITNPSAALLKATIISGARSLSPGQYGRGGCREIPGGARPNNVEGWGHIDVAGTLFPANGTNVYHDITNGISTGETNVYSFTVTTTNRVSITLVWSDYPAVLPAGPNLVNSLDLVAISGDSVRHYPNGQSGADHLNNVQTIDLDPAPLGTCLIYVSGYNVAYGPQPYALVIHATAAAPLITDLWCEPDLSTNYGPITINTLVSSNYGAIAAVSNFYRIDSGDWQALAMGQQSSSTDGLLFTNEIPGQANGTVIDYFTTARTADGLTDESETNTYTVVGYVYYVATNGTATAPYDTWEKASTNIQMAIDIAPANNATIVIGSGVYQFLAGHNAVIDIASKALTVQGVGDVTILAPGNKRGILLTTDSLIEGITVTNGGGYVQGGGVYMSAGTLRDCVIKNGWAYYGGNIYMNDNGVLENCEVLGGAVYDAAQGGGIYLSGVAVVSNCFIHDNSATYGGGLLANAGGFVKNSTLFSNSVAGFGGGAYLLSGGSLSNCLIKGNTASYSGGGVSFDNGGTVYGSLIITNTAASGAGIVFGSSGEAVNCTISDNTGTGGSGGVGYTSGSDFAIYNSIIFGNYSSDNTTSNYPEAMASNMFYSCTVPTSETFGPGSIAADPLFVDRAGGNYRLAAGSPCYNAGTNLGSIIGAFDLAGTPRIIDGRVDMGAYEYFTFGISPTSTTIAVTASTGTFWVLASTGYVWNATVNSSASEWLSIVTGASGSGTGAVTYAATYNTNHHNRIGTIGVADRTFTITQALCLVDAPAILPATEVGTSNFDANWSAVSQATNYLFDASTAHSFGSFLDGYHDRSVWPSTSCTVTNLAPNTPYYYRVRAETTSFVSVYSAVQGVTNLPRAPLVQEATELATNQFKANWLGYGAQRYLLDVSFNSAFASFVGDYHDYDADSQTALLVTNLLSGTSYYYRVRAENASGFSAYSATAGTHTVLIPPTALPASAMTTNSFSANWESSFGASSYLLDAARDSSFNDYVAGYASRQVEAVTTYSVTGLAAGIIYYYRVQATNSGGVSDYSATESTITVPAAPIVSAATEIMIVSFQANWAEATGATNYFLDAATDSGFGQYLPGYENLAVGLATSYSVTGTTAGAQHYYRLRAANASGTSIDSATMAVTNANWAPGVLPATNITINSFWANWNETTGATTYILYVAPTNNFRTCVPGYSNLDVGLVVTWPVSNLHSHTPYYYRLQAENSNGRSEYSSIQNVVTMHKTGIVDYLILILHEQ